MCYVNVTPPAPPPPPPPPLTIPLILFAPPQPGHIPFSPIRPSAARRLYLFVRLMVAHRPDILMQMPSPWPELSNGKCRFDLSTRDPSHSHSVTHCFFIGVRCFFRFRASTLRLLAPGGEVFCSAAPASRFSRPDPCLPLLPCSYCSRGALTWALELFPCPLAFRHHPLYLFRAKRDRFA